MDNNVEAPQISEKERFLGEFKERFKGIKSWSTPIKPVGEKLAFRNWGLEAEEVFGGESFPNFPIDRRETFEHTGFARGLRINDKNAFIKSLDIRKIIHPFSRNDYAFLDKGDIRYAQVNDVSAVSRKELQQGEDIIYTIWRNGNFTLAEVYKNPVSPFIFREAKGGISEPAFASPPPYKKEYCQNIELISRSKMGEYIDENSKMRVEVLQETNETEGLGDKFSIRVGNSKEHRDFSAINLKLDPNHPDYQRVVAQMQADPEFFQSTEKVISLLRGVNVDPSSLVYYGFKDGKQGKYNLFTDVPKVSKRIIEKDLPFEEAMKIAFPKVTETP